MLKSDVIESSHEPHVEVPSHRIWDRLGIIGSALCVIHCTTTPLAIGFLSAAGLGFLGGEIFHQVLAVLLVAIAVLAFLPGFKMHGNKAVLVLGGLGVGLLLLTGFVLEPLISHGAEIGLTMAGSAFLLGAHGYNWRLSRESACCTSESGCPK